MTTAATNKALVCRYFEEPWNRGDLAAIEQLVTEDFIGHDPATRQEPRGLVGLRQVITSYRAAFPDLHATIEEQVP